MTSRQPLIDEIRSISGSMLLELRATVLSREGSRQRYTGAKEALTA